MMAMLIDYFRGGGEYCVHARNEEKAERVAGFLSDPGLPVFEVTNVHEYLAVNEKKFMESVRDAIPCAIPPFPDCWMEFRSADTSWVCGSAVRQVGCLLSSWDIRDRDVRERAEALRRLNVPPERVDGVVGDLCWLVLGVFGLRTNDGNVGLGSGFTWLFLDREGRILKPMLPGFSVDQDLTAGEMEAAAMIALKFMAVIAMACSFLSCRNVRRVENEPDAKLQKARQRRGKPPLTKYYTLEIEPMKEVLRREGRSEEVGLKKALHICRGHFATYTEEKPLFGRPGATGRFWIPSHVRGSKDAGEIRKDYSIQL